MFRFANAYGTTIGSRGFETDDAAFVNDWMQHYNDITSQTFAANDFSVNQNDPAGGYIRNTLLIWLWTLISPRLPAYDTANFIGHKLHINFQSKTFNTDNALNDDYMRQRDNINTNSARYGTTPASHHEIEIIFIKKGHDAMKYFHTHYADKEIPSVGTLLTVDRYHKINVIRGDTGKITILTTRWDDMALYKLIGLLPVFFEDIKAVVDSDTTIYTLLKSFFDNDPDPVRKIMADAIKEYAKEMFKRNIDKLYAALESQKNKTIKSLESTINSINSNIEEYLRRLSQKYDELEANQRNLTGYLVNPWVADANLRPFLEKSKNIHIIKLNGDQNWMQLQFTTPIMNWNKQDVEMYFKHKPTVQQTYLNNPDWFAEIMKKTFLDEEYQMICTTIVTMPILNKSNAEDLFSTQSSPEGTMGNPHFTEFNCYASSRQAYLKAINGNDYVRAISIIMAATATLVFTDSSVIRRMSEYMKEGSAYNKLCFRSVATGETMSVKNLREHLAEEKRKAAEPVFYPATAPTGEDNTPADEPRLAF